MGLDATSSAKSRCTISAAGTFDISILEIGNGVFEVISTAGDTFLGGEDFDRRVIDWLVFGFQKEHDVDLRKDKMALQRLKDVAEKAKCELSSVRETEINLPFIISTGRNEALHMQTAITRDKLEELTLDLCERTTDICAKTLAEAEITKDEIEDVVLVGGMTRMPRIQQAVAEFFGIEPCKGVHPDEVVALGAAIQGAALTDEASDILLLDVTPHSLGIMIVGGYFHRLIEQNTTVPTSKSHVFTTVKDNQTSVKILVLQGESDRAEENELLGEFALTGLRRAQRGEVEIEVTFHISADGIVSVKARDFETGLEQSITVTATSGLTEDEIRKMIDANKNYMMEVRSGQEYEKHRHTAEKILDEIEGLFPQVSEIISGSDFGQDAVKKARSVCERARQAISSKNTQQLVETTEALTRTPQHVQGCRLQDQGWLKREPGRPGAQVRRVQDSDTRDSAESPVDEQSISERVDALVDRGLERYATGDLEGALSEWEHAMVLSPDNERAKEYTDYVKEHFEVLVEQFQKAQAVAELAAELDVPFGIEAVDAEAFDLEDEDDDDYDDLEIVIGGGGDEPAAEPEVAPAVTAVRPVMQDVDEGWFLDERADALPPPPEDR